MRLPMPERARIAASLEGWPALVRLVPSEVDDEAWYRIALAAADETPRPGAPMFVRPERLVSERLVLRGLLQRHRVAFDADDGVRLILRRGSEDRDALRAALAGERRPILLRGDRPPADVLQLRRELRPFQLRDLDRLANLRHGANFSVPGAGKTTVSYALHAQGRNTANVARLLVVAPLSAFGAWEEDGEAVLDPPLRVARWRGGGIPACDVLLVNYHRVQAAAPHLITWMLQQPTHLIVDEAHRAKRGARGEWGRAIQAIAPFAVRRDVLTGTPAPNHPRDLAAILDILWPGGVASGLVPAAALRSDPPQAAMTDVHRAIAPLYVRTTKQELALPPVRIVRDVVPMGELQQQIYDALLSRYAGMYDLDRRDAAMFAQMGEIAMYLLQAASSPRLLAANPIGAQAYRFPPLAIPAGSRLARLVEQYADHELPSKIERASRIVHANAMLGRKTLVWSNFPDNLLDLERQLAGLHPALVYGAVPPGDDDPEPGVRTREGELARFRGDDDCLVLLANPAALAEGVSLHHACHDAVYIDRTFNAGQYLQSLDRIHRLGLQPDVETRITLLLNDGTIDQRVDRRVEDKTRRLATMLSDPALVQMALPDDEDPGDFFDDAADLEDVMRHLAEGVPHNDLG